MKTNIARTQAEREGDILVTDEDLTVNCALDLVGKKPMDDSSLSVEMDEFECDAFDTRERQDDHEIDGWMGRVRLTSFGRHREANCVSYTGRKTSML